MLSSNKHGAESENNVESSAAKEAS